MDHFVENFDPFDWGTQGPMLLSGVYAHKCLASKWHWNNCPTQVAKVEVFYPFSCFNFDFFRKHNFYLTSRTLALHLWNHNTMQFKENFNAHNTFSRFMNVCLHMTAHDNPLPMPFNATPSALPKSYYLWDSFDVARKALQRLFHFRAW